MKDKIQNRRYFFIATITVIFGIFLYLQYYSSPIVITKIIPTDFNKLIILFFLLILAILFELLRIIFYESIITIQVTVTLTILYLFGKNYAIIFVMVYYFFPLFNRKYSKTLNLYNMYLKYSHHLILTILTANLFEYILPYTGSKWLSLVIAALVYKTLNFLIVDLGWLKILKVEPKIKYISRIFFLELWMYISAIPLAILLTPIANNGVRVYSIDEILSAFYFVIILTFLIKSYSKKTNLYDQLKYELQKNKNISSKLKKILQTIRKSESFKNYESFANEMAYDIAHIFEYNYVLINKLNYTENKIERVASYGLPEEDFEKLKNNPPPINFYKIFAKEENRISNSFFFSLNQDKNQDYIYYPKIHLLESEYENDSEKINWDKDHTLVVPIGKAEKPIGYISLDQPQSGKFPPIEILRLLELFAQNIASHFNLVAKIDELNKENLQDPITSLYGIRYLKNINDGDYKNLVLIDIKNFKSINAKYGLEKSDEVLKILAKIIKKYTRKSDIVIRYIGDWFLLFTNSQYKEIERELNTISIVSKNIKIDGENLGIVLQFSAISIQNKKIKDAILEAKNKLAGESQLN